MAKKNNNQQRKDNRKPMQRKRGESRPYRDKEDRRDDSRYDGVAHKQSGFNDVSWYAKNDRLLRDSASFSYNNPVGTKIPYHNMISPAGTAAGIVVGDDTISSVPSTMALTYIPGPGLSIDSSSPANLAAQNIYTYVRYMNSGAKNYDQADLMLYLLAMDSIYMMWNWVKRAYGYARTYSQVNRTIPRTFAWADGIDYDDLIANLADYRYQINSLAAQISSFCVPAVMPIFIRHSWMASNIYKDSGNDKSQYYMFTPGCFYVYEETVSKDGGLLDMHVIPHTTRNTLKTVLSWIKEQLDAVAYSEDIGVMSGDILKAYGQNQLFKITPLEPDYTVVPVYNEEVLNQIHNATIIDVGDLEASNLNITQNPNTGYLIYSPAIPLDEDGFMPGYECMVNMPWDDVTPANTMVGTRLTTITTVIGGKARNFVSLGSEFICMRRAVWYDPDSSSIRDATIPYAVVIGQDQISTSSNRLRNLTVLSNFDWHQLTPIVMKTDENRYYVTGFLGDIDNYTIINRLNLQQMHTSALLSEFNVPQIGSF